MTTFAPVTNFAYALIDGGITSVATAFSVVSGGSKFPLPSMDGNFNATIWNVTDYESAHLDPNAEIVTVTARSTNAFTVTRGSESTSAVAHNTTGKTYAIALTFTKASYDALGTEINARVTIDQTVGQTIGTTGARLTKLWATDITVTNAIVGSITGNAATVTNATLTTALTVNTGTVTLVGNVANNSVLTIGAGAVSVSGTNTGDQTNISGNAATVTTNANLTGPITSVGNATSVASQTGTGSTFVMSAGPSFTGSITHSITAQASVAETFHTFSISDDATGRFYIENNSATDNFFVPGLRGVTTGNARGLTIVGQGTTDTGSNPLMELRSRIGTSSASSTRPLLHITNHTTIVGIVSADGSITLGSTAGTGTGTLYSGKIQHGATAPTQSQGSALTVNSNITTGAAGSAGIIIQGEVNKERIKIYSAGGSGTGGPLFNMFSFRGTLASPTATQNGDLLSGVSGGGYGATAFSGNQYVFLQYATENWTDTAKGCYTAFFTVPNGSTSLTGRLLINHDGAVTLGSSFGTGTGALYAGVGTFTGLLTTVASASGGAGFRVPHGAAPSSPVNGDIWTSTSGMFVRINGVTKTVTLT